MGTFESIGISCELGLVQRHCRLEQPGLFRFGYTPIKGLIAALNSSFADIGKPAEIKLRIAEPSREWMTTHQRFGFEFHTEHYAPQFDEDVVRERLAVQVITSARLLMDHTA
jgi:hypothetical protein